MKLASWQVLFLCSSLAAPVARATSWTKLSSGNPAVYLTGINSPDGTHIFTVGMEVNTSGSFPTATPHVYTSSDEGTQFTEISGNLAQVSGLNSTGAIAFTDAQHGWVSVGPMIYRTTTGGTSWTGVSVGASTNDLHAFDTMHLIRIGNAASVSLSSDGGQTWTPASMPPAQDDLIRMCWTDSQHGWVSGQIADDNGIATETDVFFTSDGGQTWKDGATLSGVAAGPLFFLSDQMTGWVATRQQTDMSSQPDPNTAIVHLSSTTNGGQTFTDMNLPTDVGTITALGSSQPITTATIYALYWADADRGHLVGAAYLGSESTSTSGGMLTTSQATGFWKLVDYQTTDGGQSWQKTNLGTIQENLAAPPSDGEFTWGVFQDLDNGWLSANADTVWGYQQACTSNSDCGADYECSSGRCMQQPGSGTSADGGLVPLAATRLPRVGCSCGAGAADAWPLLALLFARRRRGRRC